MDYVVGDPHLPIPMIHSHRNLPVCKALENSVLTGGFE
jgi:hypothetical protein